MSSNQTRRIYINSITAAQDTGESTQDFVADFESRLEGLIDINIGTVSLNFTPISPNIPLYESEVTMTRNGVERTFGVPIDAIYNSAGGSPDSPQGSGGTTTLVFQLNKAFKLAYAITTEPFWYDFLTARIVFDAEDGLEYSFLNTGARKINRRLGLSTLQENIAFTGMKIMRNPPIISRTQVIYLVCNIVSDSMLNGENQNSQILGMMPLRFPEFGAINNWSPNYNLGSVAPPRDFSNIRFSLLDEMNQPMDFNSNTQLLIELGLVYEGQNSEGDAGQLRLPLRSYQ